MPVINPNTREQARQEAKRQQTSIDSGNSSVFRESAKSRAKVNRGGQQANTVEQDRQVSQNETVSRGNNRYQETAVPSYASQDTYDQDEQRQNDKIKKRLDQISAEEVRRAAKEREEERQEKIARAAHLDQLAAEELKNVEDQRQKKRSELEAKNERLDIQAEGILQEVQDTVRRREEMMNSLADQIFEDASKAVYGNEEVTDPGMRSLGYVDTETGEIFDNTPGEMSRSEMAYMLNDKLPWPEYPEELSPLERSLLLDDKLPQVGYESARHAGNVETNSRGNGHGRHFMSSDDMLEAMLQASKEKSFEEELDRGTRIGTLSQPTDKSNKERSFSDDAAWSFVTDITGLKNSREQRKRISKNSGRLFRNEYKRTKEEIGNPSDYDLDAQSRGDTFYDWNAYEQEAKLSKKLAKARNAIRRRFFNPSLLRIEGEWIEKKSTMVNGEERTYGRLRYSPAVEGAIGNVRTLYKCSFSDVMQLIQLRAGLGVDKNGKIAKVNPNKFYLTEAQVVELCKDMVESQKVNGHPLGAVEGIPGAAGVRDDTGRFVVVAGTRCFPLGYMPKQLVENLRKDWQSPLHGQSVGQIESMLKEEWLGKTYPILCANTGGNIMFQARAIENMMRGLMSIDGIDPSELGIPEVMSIQTRMQIEAELAAATDDGIREALQVRKRRIEQNQDAWHHRYYKENGTRDSDGNLQSVAVRRRTTLGDDCRAFCNLIRANSAFRFFVRVSGVAEAKVAMLEQNIGFSVSKKVLKMQKGYDPSMENDYGMTTNLRRMSKTREAIEARAVAERLYSLGGQMAIDAFLNPTDEYRTIGDYTTTNADLQSYKLTNADFRRFLIDSGVVGEEGISAKARRIFDVKPGQERSFIGFVNHMFESSESAILGTSGMSKEAEQFVDMSMFEMESSAVFNNEMSSIGVGTRRVALTNSQVERMSGGDGETLVRELLQTEAGMEALMTQGITSLGRKSPMEHAIRHVLNANGVTELLITTMFDKFILYGAEKIQRLVPMSNTLSYLAAHNMTNAGSFLSNMNDDENALSSRLGGMLERTESYQTGGRLSVKEGLRKNIIYDTVMTASKLAMAGVMYMIIKMLGGIFPPEQEEDKLTLSEWIIGSGEWATPIKWAWWMDDLSGISIPFAGAWAIIDQGGGTPEAYADGVGVFINSLANFNSGTALLDAIDMVKNFDDEIDNAFGTDFESYNPSFYDKMRMTGEIMAWDLLGDMTPAIIGELLPWSRDFLFRGDSEEHTPYKVYTEDGKSTKQVESYEDAVRRRESQNNWLMGGILDLVNLVSKDSTTGYLYSEMPVNTTTDDLAKLTWNMFLLDTDPRTTNVLDKDGNPLKEGTEEYEEAVYAKAEDVCQWIRDNYSGPYDALSKGFVINPEMRMACAEYCRDRANAIDAEKDALIEDVKLSKYNGRRIPDVEYNNLVEPYEKMEEEYWGFYNDYFKDGTVIPWTLPKYVQQTSDIETRYVDENQRPATWLNYALPQPVRNVMGSISRALGNEPMADMIEMENVQPQKYRYGNVPSVFPFSSPRTVGKAFSHETIPYWMLVDENGNSVTDTQAIYDMLGDQMVESGRNKGKSYRELLFGGQGNNKADDIDEILQIAVDNGITTLGNSTDSRTWKIIEDTIPEEYRELDRNGRRKILGLTEIESEESEEEEKDKNTNAEGSYYGISYYGSGYGGGRSYYGGGKSYYGGYYGSSGSSGTYSSYNPKIYSSAKQVYSDRAAGLQTRQPYKATSTYLRPNFYTKGSREAYKRSDI